MESNRPKTGIYVPPDWGGVWLPKLTAAASAGAIVACIGDSVTQRLYASTYANSWVGKLRTALQTANGDGGSGYLSTANAAANTGQMAQFADRIAVTGTWAANSFGGLKAGPAGAAISSTVDGSTATFPTRGSRVRIFTLTYPGSGTFTYAIDGGTPVTIDTNNANYTVQVTTITGLSTGAHSVVITKTGTTLANVCGIEGCNPGSGVRVDNFGHSGAASEYFNNVAGTWGSGQNAETGKWSGGYQNPADLIIYALGLNDASGAVAADTFADNIRFYMDYARGNGSTLHGAADILFVSPHVGKFDHATTPKYHQYTQRLRGIAESYGAAYIDLWAIYRNNWDAFNDVSGWGIAGGTGGTGGAGSEVVHPGDIGHGLYEAIIAPVVLTGRAT